MREFNFRERGVDMNVKILFPAKAILSAIAPLALVISIVSAGPGQKEKMDHLMVFGQGFMFGVQEPDGWRGDTERAAKYHVNVIFFRGRRMPSDLEGVIRVRINKKADEDTAKDLAVDMDGYRKRFPDIRFEDFAVSHSRYSSYPKLFYVEGQFHEYVVYINPGEGFWYTFSVALGTGETPASEAELAAFRTVTSSLLAMGGKAPAAQVPTDFDSALAAADENLKSKEGEKYDVAFARKAGPWISRALAGCTKGLPASDLGPFTVLVRVAETGQAEEVLVRPETKVALCLKPSFAGAKNPKPPGPSWWVKVVIAIR